MEDELTSMRKSISKWRDNTVEQKRKMRRERNKRKRQLLKRKGSPEPSGSVKKAELDDKMKEAERYKQLAKKYMGLWKSSVSKRPQTVKELKGERTTQHDVRRIDRDDLTSAEFDGNQVAKGKGAFGKCYLKIYQGNLVAVKEFRKEVSKADVVKEASIVCSLSHPGLPIVLGIDISMKPWLMVSLFYGIEKRSTTLYEVLRSPCNEWQLNRLGSVSIIVQISNVLKYLHHNNVIHNDLKGDNVMLTKNLTEFKAIIIDFGKACSIVDGETKHLPESSKKVYRDRHSHVAPEVVDGLNPQSPASDVFALGRVILQIGEFCKCKQITKLSSWCLNDLAKRCSLSFVIEECELLILKQ